MSKKDTIPEKQSTTMTIHSELRNALHKIGKDVLEPLYKDKPKKPRITYNDTLSYLIREQKLKPFLTAALNNLSAEYDAKLNLIRNHINDVGIQINGQKVRFDIFEIPGVKTFIEDNDLKIIGNVKKKLEK